MIFSLELCAAVNGTQLINDDQVGFIVGGRPERMAPIRPTVAWDICGPIATKADAAKARDGIAKVNAQGIGYMCYFGLGHIETAGSKEELWKEFSDFKLKEEGRKVDLDGNVATGNYDVSTTTPAYLETVVQILKNMVDAGGAAVGVDEGWGSCGPGYSADFNKHALSGFRELLKENFSETELKEKYDIENINTFDYAAEIRKIPVIVRDAEGKNGPGKPFCQVWWRARIQREIEPGEKLSAETLGHQMGNAGGMPLVREWIWYNHETLRKFHKEIILRSKVYAESVGREWHVYINVYTDLGEGGNIWLLADQLDIVVGETWPEFPEEHMTSFYKNIRSRGKRFWPMDWPGQELTPMHQPNNGLIETFLAEAYTNGCYAQYPEVTGAHKRRVDAYFMFIKKHERFFRKSDAEIAVMYSLSNCAGTLRREGRGAREYHGAARLLEDLHRSYDVVFAGNDTWVSYDLTLRELTAYKAIVLPWMRYLSPQQRRLILEYTERGGIVLAMGDIGTHGLNGNRYPSSE